MSLLKVLHETPSQGVLYQFRDGARVWQERQHRFRCIGGELNGKMCTAYEVSQCTTPNWYHRYVAQDRGDHPRNIWLFISE